MAARDVVWEYACAMGQSARVTVTNRLRFGSPFRPSFEGLIRAAFERTGSRSWTINIKEDSLDPGQVLIEALSETGVCVIVIAASDTDEEVESRLTQLVRNL